MAGPQYRWRFWLGVSSTLNLEGLVWFVNASDGAFEQAPATIKIALVGWVMFWAGVTFAMAIFGASKIE